MHRQQALGLVLLSFALACGGPPPRVAPPAPTPDPRLSLAEPIATPRVGASGAPVDCVLQVGNRSGMTLARLIVACELLDADGISVGAGLGVLQNVPDGENRRVRTVVYGVRNFASARAVINSADFR